MKLASLIRIFLPFSGILGGPVVVPTKPGMEWTLDACQVQWTLAGNSAHWAVDEDAMQWTLSKDD
jgi:hypothetical protein